MAVMKFIENDPELFNDIELVPCQSITEVINNVDSLENAIAVVPVENSIEGIVRETLDTLVKTSSKVMIRKEIITRISHCLITKAQKYDDIKTIVSYTQALGQCNEFINRNFSHGVEIVTSKSTSEAVKSLIDKPDYWAAIGTRIAADYYNLPVLKEGINDQKENFTKFVLLDNHLSEPTGNDLSSIAISVRNKPGALVDILVPFSENNINLCRIESRPSKKNLGDYLFFIDFDGHIQDQKVKDTIGKIAPYIDFYRFLGSYPKCSRDRQHVANL
jgi:prephenate dehydratase